MNLRELANFIRIVEIGSLSRAAATLNVAQPALGLQIRNLEAEFKKQLLVRHSRGVYPTDAGKILLVHARQILQEVDKSKRAIGELDARSGLVRVGMTTSANGLLLAELYRLCQERHPNIRLDIIEGNSGRLARMIQTGEIELGCLYSDGGISGLRHEIVLNDEWVFVSTPRNAPAGGSIPFSTIEGLPLVLPSRSSGLRLRIEQEARARGMELNVVLEVQSGTLMQRLIEQGVGHTVLPKFEVRDAIATGRLRAARIVEPQFPSRTHISHRESPPLGPSAMAVKSLLMEVAERVWAHHQVEPDVAKRNSGEQP